MKRCAQSRLHDYALSPRCPGRPLLPRTVKRPWLLAFPRKRLVNGFTKRFRGNASPIDGIRRDVRSCRRPGVVGTPCFRETRVVMPLRAAIDCAEERLAGDELVDVAIRSPEVLPGRSWFAEQLDASTSQLVHCRG